MLVLEEGMTEITGILLEYDVWHRYTAGVFPRRIFLPRLEHLHSEELRSTGDDDSRAGWNGSDLVNRSEKAKTAAAPARRNVPHRICVFLKETFLTLRFAEGALLCCGIYVLLAIWSGGARKAFSMCSARPRFSVPSFICSRFAPRFPTPCDTGKTERTIWTT